MKSILFLLLVNFLALHVVAQSKQVRGQVINKEGEHLAGVSVLVKETREGTTTNNNGEFKLVTKKEFPLTLEFTSVGFKLLNSSKVRGCFFLCKINLEIEIFVICIFFRYKLSDCCSKKDKFGFCIILLKK